MVAAHGNLTVDRRKRETGAPGGEVEMASAKVVQNSIFDSKLRP